MYPDKTSQLSSARAVSHVHGRPVGVPVPVVQFVLAGLIAIAAMFALVSATVPATVTVSVLIGPTVFAAAMTIAVVGFAKTYPHEALGWCNAVTIARLALVAILASWIVMPPKGEWLFVGLALLTLALDGVDGWLARAEGFTSDFGARFDMEVDALLSLVLAAYAFTSGPAGAIVILLALPRYVFLAAQAVVPWLGLHLPERFRRKLVCVVQLAVLILLATPTLTPIAANLVASLALGLVVWSFWLDIRWLAQTRT